jgi:hypothetical protein
VPRRLRVVLIVSLARFAADFLFQALFETSRLSAFLATSKASFHWLPLLLHYLGGPNARWWTLRRGPAGSVDAGAGRARNGPAHPARRAGRPHTLGADVQPPVPRKVGGARRSRASCARRLPGEARNGVDAAGCRSRLSARARRAPRFRWADRPQTDVCLTSSWICRCR